MKTLLLTAALAYASLALVGVLWSDRMIFLPPSPTYSADTLPVRLIAVGRERRLAVLYLPNPDSTHTLLFSHGNGEDLGYIRAYLEQLRGSGFSVLAFDYRGYGLSDGGPPGERATYRDIEAVYDHAIRELHVAPDRLIVHGRSVGTGPSLHLAATRPVGGVIVESGFTSAFRVLTRVPLLPFDKFPNLARIREVRAPVLVIHGTQDDVIPFRMGRELFAAAPEPKKSLWVQGAGHNDLAWVAGPSYWNALRDFAVAAGERRPSGQR